MKSIVLLAVGWTLFLQGPKASPSPQLSPRELLNAQRPLTSAEIASVLAASRDALAGKTLRFSAGGVGSGIEMLMRSDGQVARFRASYGLVSGVVSASGQSRQWTEDITKIVDYTNRPARPCDGSTGSTATATATAATGELVIEYTHRRTTPEQQPPGWSVTARRSTEREPLIPGLIPAFEMLRGVGTLASDDDSQRQRIGDRWARGFVARFVSVHDERHHRSSPLLIRSTPLIGDPQPNVAGEPPPREEPKPVQALWIDTESLLPLRWEVTDHGRRLQHYDFVFEPIDMQLPADVTLAAPPDCIR